MAGYSELRRGRPGCEARRMCSASVCVEEWRRDSAAERMSAADETLTKAAAEPGAGRETFFYLGEVKFSKGDTADAMKWYQKAASADPSWGKPLYKLGMSALKQGDRGAASDFLTKTITVD